MNVLGERHLPLRRDRNLNLISVRAPCLSDSFSGRHLVQ